MDNSIIHKVKNTISSNLEAIRGKIKEVALSSARTPEDITLLAVSKRHSAEVVTGGILCGITNLGENRLQEAAEKIPRVKDYLDSQNFDSKQIKWHMIGRLQSNKAANAARLFDVIESVESWKVANKLSATICELGKTLDVFIEVNTSGEPQKGGIQPNEVRAFVREIMDLPGLKLVGLMTIGPHTSDQNRIRASFRELRSLKDDIIDSLPGSSFLGKLSMGMSGDFPLAIAEGSTEVRIGTSVFGNRPD
ncbi:MAG: YggS family pyridoxal phosphate-dependent enzyme [SAR324 cluster bacterium]|nr:YggS family pyridoxal phosphate-dependent enzyme [SAR324 cluster bacterium]